MITEREAEEALPSYDCFLRDYYFYAKRQTTAPAAYHIPVALSALSATCPLNFGMNYAGTLRGNMFAMLVGRSGDDQKSTAAGIGRDLLFEADARLIGDMPGSSEGLIDSLSRQSTQLVIYKEFGKFLAQAQRGYMEPIKALMTDLYDCEPQQRAKANRQVVRVDNPRLSILAACSGPFLEKHTEAVDWTGGFLSRWFVMHANRERVDPDPVGDTTGRGFLVQGLFDLVNAKPDTVGWCEGLTDEARDLWNDWFHSVDKRPLPPTISGVRSRVPAMARKTALLLGWENGNGRQGGPWKIGMAELFPALMIAELHLKSIISLSEIISEHGDARLRRTVLDALPPGSLKSLGDIIAYTKMKKKTITEALDSLCEEGTVVRYNVPGSAPVFTRAAGGPTGPFHTEVLAESPEW
jgi:hypothetical protein